MSSNNSIIKEMRVALVHDYIKEYGGAERVLETLHEMWPEAPVFTTVYLPQFLGPHQKRFKNWNIKTSLAQYLPFKAKLISPLRLFAPLLFKTFNFSDFDVVIVSATGAYLPNMINKKSALQTCYCHTPPRYLYGYATAREWKKIGVVRVVGEVMNHFLRLVDFKSAQNVDYFIANSQEVRSRIKKFYRKEAVVIYPPVSICHPERKRRISGDSSSAKWRTQNDKKKDYYLAGGRLARAKGIDIIIEAFTKLKKPLKIFGRGFAGYDRNIKYQISNSKYKNIEFLGEVSDEEKLELMRNAKAYVFTSFDEDFGITPVEAMSVGTPVIAYRSGGVQETVIDGKTGIFFDEPIVESLVKAIKSFDKLRINAEDCIRQAQKFSKERFKKEILQFVTEITYGKKEKG